MINRIVLNETSYFGRGAREKLSEEIKARHFQKILVVTDKSLLETGTVTLVTDVLEKNQINYITYDGVKPNPTVQNVQDGVKIAKDNAVDCIVAIGGGSSIDTAKAIAVIMTNPEFSDVVSLDGTADTKNKALPLIALPTTAGTAAEVTINYVITDEVRTKKMVCVDVHDIPVAAETVQHGLAVVLPRFVKIHVAVAALKHVFRAGKALFHQHACGERPAHAEGGMHSFHQRAVDIGLKRGGHLGVHDAEGVHKLLYRKPQKLARHGRGAEIGHGAGMGEAGQARAGTTDAAHDFRPENDGLKELLSRTAAQALRHGERRGKAGAVRMQEGVVVGVVEVQGLKHGRIDHARIHGMHLFPEHQHGAARGAAHFLRPLGKFRHAGGGRTGKTHAQRIHDDELVVLQHPPGYVAECGPADKFGKFQNRVHVFSPKSGTQGKSPPRNRMIT